MKPRINSYVYVFDYGLISGPFCTKEKVIKKDKDTFQTECDYVKGLTRRYEDFGKVFNRFGWVNSFKEVKKYYDIVLNETNYWELEVKKEYWE